MNRLTNVLGSDNLAEVFEYDLAGNRTQMTRNGQSTSYTYNTLNQLKNMTADSVLTEYAYDANGDIRTESINGNQTTYAFDGFRRLSSVNMSNGSVQQNYYNTENLRTALVENGKFRGMLYSGSRVLAEYDGQDALINRYHIGKGIVASENTSGINYFHQNGHGDVSTITNETGQAVEKYSYSAFGELTSTNHKLDNRFLYSGEQLDPLTGDYYLRARMYRPSIGRFLAEDVYRGDGMNLYAYVGNNPLIYVDPTGWMKEGTLPDFAEYQLDEFSLRMENGETVIWENVKPELLEAKVRFEELIAENGWSITYTSAYRPYNYQGHLREITEKVKDNSLSDEERAFWKKEFKKHGLIGVAAKPSANAPHTKGIAFDATIFDSDWKALNGRNFISDDLKTVAKDAGLHCDIKGDYIHFYVK